MLIASGAMLSVVILSVVKPIDIKMIEFVLIEQNFFFEYSFIIS
jgi:hypothetical protein